MHYLKVKGSYFEIGKQIGIAFKKEINDYIEFRYYQMCSEMQEMGYLFQRKDYEAYVPDLKEYIRQNAIDEYQELVGISQATSQRVEDIIFSIGYTDIFDLILKSKTKKRELIEHELNSECSTFVIDGSLQKMCGQNWDMDMVSKENACIMQKEYSDGLKICAVTTILGLVHMGMNDVGVCAGTANLSTENVSSKGIIFPIVLQNILKTKNRSETLNILNKYKFVSGHYFYIMYPTEHSLLFETVATRYQEIRFHNNIFVHTNHYVDMKLKEEAISYSLSSIERKQAMEEYLQQNNDLSDQNIKKILANHEKGICRHSENKFETVTAASVIFKPKEKQMQICNNAPCIGEWLTVNMDSIFKEE